jgi:hypothetical protein
MEQPKCEHCRAYGSSTNSLHARPLNAGNSASRASTWLDDKVPERKSSSIPLGAGEAVVAAGAIPNHCLRSTSPRWEAGMCANGNVHLRPKTYPKTPQILLVLPVSWLPASGAFLNLTKIIMPHIIPFCTFAIYPPCILCAQAHTST